MCLLVKEKHNRTLNICWLSGGIFSVKKSHNKWTTGIGIYVIFHQKHQMNDPIIRNMFGDIKNRMLMDRHLVE